MADKKNWGSTVLGWFVVQEGASPADAPGEGSSGSADDDAIRRASGGSAGQPAPNPSLNVFSSPPPAAPGGKVDFDKVFDAAGIVDEERQRVARTFELLNSLPPGTDETVKKQIVMASLRAFGVPIEKIIEAGAAELQALEGYIRSGAADTAKVAEEADQRIKQYEEEIVKLKTVMQDRVAEQQGVIKSCNERKLEVQKVLEFFGQEAVAKVVRDSPRLHEPTA